MWWRAAAGDNWIEAKTRNSLAAKLKVSSSLSCLPPIICSSEKSESWSRKQTFPITLSLSSEKNPLQVLKITFQSPLRRAPARIHHSSPEHNSTLQPSRAPTEAHLSKQHHTMLLGAKRKKKKKIGNFCFLSFCFRFLLIVSFLLFFTPHHRPARRERKSTHTEIIQLCCSNKHKA